MGRIRVLNGYKLVYKPNHPSAMTSDNWLGFVYEHIYVMEKHIRRTLDDDEVVHHKDRVRDNNCLSNLMLMTRSEHSNLHSREDRGFSGTENITCNVCSKEIVSYTSRPSLYCSYVCNGIANRRFDVDRQELYTLVWKYPTKKVAEMLGVSDSAISKRCKKLNIPKPTRGYWAKISAGSTVDIPPLRKGTV